MYLQLQFIITSYVLYFVWPDFFRPVLIHNTNIPFFLVSQTVYKLRFSTYGYFFLALKLLLNSLMLIIQCQGTFTNIFILISRV